MKRPTQVTVIFIIAFITMISSFSIPLSGLDNSGNNITKVTAADSQSEIYGYYYEIPAAEFVIQGECFLESDVLRISGTGSVQISIPEDIDGQYEIGIDYRLEPDNSRPFNIQMSVNASTATEYEFARQYYDQTSEGRIKQDSRGNDIKPVQLAVDDFIRAPFRMPDFRAGEYLSFRLREGSALKLDFEEQHAEIRCIYVYERIIPASYAPFSPEAGNNMVVVEAEQPELKSSAMLYPITDRTSTKTTPYHFAKIKLNSIGGNNWKIPGQWISWNFDVPEDGYYRITLRAKQSYLRGMKSFRRIEIDGKVPYKELEAYEFLYDRAYQQITLQSDNEEIYFHFTKGKHDIRMEALMADALSLDDQLTTIIYELNLIYRQIVMITGIIPDANRTYDLMKQIPNLKTRFESIRQYLDKLSTDYEVSVNSKSSELSFLKELSLLIGRYLENSDRISTSLDQYKSNISRLSALLYNLRQQPLEIDKIIISQKDAVLPRANSNFAERMVHEFRSFIASFYTDYTVIGEDSQKQKSLDVWITTGRDQAQILKSMIDDTFTPQGSTGVNLSLVQAGLIEATMAGRGPDIALTVGRTLPVDLGVRGSLYDLSQFESFEDIRARFQKTAFNAYTFKGKVYAIPETQEFNMMFVRSDILDEFAITVPKTWEELFQLLSAFSQQNMLVGIPPAILGTLLAQNGMNYYEPSFQKTVFSSNEAYKVYEEFAKIYRDYEMPYAYDAGNRFRVGEMPVVIASFSFFNTISVLAPEIRGSWDMYEVPGTVKPDGSIDNSVDASGASTVMFKACDDPLAGMEFIEWWSSAESQSRYGIELENILGPSGRYSTANIEAFASLNWSNTQHKKIAAQRKNVKEIPEVPGGYIIARNINNLFIDTIANRNNIRESLLRYSRIMDEELMRKQKELEAYSRTELEAYSQGEE